MNLHGKPCREIARDPKISSRDITKIINEFENINEPRTEKSITAKAFEMFKDRNLQ